MRTLLIAARLEVDEPLEVVIRARDSMYVERLAQGRPSPGAPSRPPAAASHQSVTQSDACSSQGADKDDLWLWGLSTEVGRLPSRSTSPLRAALCSHPHRPGLFVQPDLWTMFGRLSGGCPLPPFEAPGIVGAVLASPAYRAISLLPEIFSRGEIRAREIEFVPPGLSQRSRPI